LKHWHHAGAAAFDSSVFSGKKVAFGGIMIVAESTRFSHYITLEELAKIVKVRRARAPTCCRRRP